jgi:hypothetical protein
MHISSHCIYCHQLPEFCGSCPWSFFLTCFVLSLSTFKVLCHDKICGCLSFGTRYQWAVRCSLVSKGPNFFWHYSSGWVQHLSLASAFPVLIDWLIDCSNALFNCILNTSFLFWLIGQVFGNLHTYTAFLFGLIVLASCSNAYLTQLSCFDWLSKCLGHLQTYAGFLSWLIVLVSCSIAYSTQLSCLYCFLQAALLCDLTKGK